MKIQARLSASVGVIFFRMSKNTRIHMLKTHNLSLYIPNRFDKSKIVLLFEIKNKLQIFFYFFYLVNNRLKILKSHFNLL